MNIEPLIAAFMIGLLGSTHCFGMCGGIVGALSTGLTDHLRASGTRHVMAQLAYNLGRISSYTLAGVLTGALAAQISMMGVAGDLPLGRYLAAIIMILFGIYITGWWHSLLWLERAGSYLWRYIEPLGRRLLPVRSVGQAYLLGTLWGWLPCGMVYAALALAMSSADALEGGAVMLAFGAGTLPAMLLMGVAFQRFGRLIRQPWVRRVAGLLVIGLGLFMLLASPGQHGHHAHPPGPGGAMPHHHGSMH